MSSRNGTSIDALLRMIVIPVVLGLAAGMAGAFVAESYLAISPSPSEEAALLRIGRPTPPTPAILAEGEASARLHRLDLPLYLRRSPQGTDSADQARVPQEAIGYATVITSDGWIATHQSVLAQGPVLVAVDGRLVEPKTRVADPRTGIVFLRIEAADLPVLGFEETETLTHGTSLYAQDQEGLFAAARFAGKVLPDRKIAGSLHDSDAFSLNYRLDRRLDARAVGGAVMTSGGTLSGIMVPGVSGADAFVPMHLIQPVLSEIFRGAPPSRALLGVHYLVPGENAFLGTGPSPLPGVRLSGSRAAGLPAVRSGSAADRAGLEDGDVILRIDGADLGAGPDLAELVGEYAPGAKARFEILRKGERRSFDVTFD